MRRRAWKIVAVAVSALMNVVANAENAFDYCLLCHGDNANGNYGIRAPKLSGMEPWYLTRQLPENHAIMVSLGEGLMPKAGETPEMGANPLLGFGRVYARPEVARTVDNRVRRLLNEPGHWFEQFYGWLQRRGNTLWGAAVDTL